MTLCCLDIQRLLNEFDKVCERRKLKVNFGKSKMLVIFREGDICLKGEVLEVVDVFKYMETIVCKNGGVKGDVLNKALL